MKWPILMYAILIWSFGIAQQKSPFNSFLVNADSSGNYNFIVSGHFYGDGTNKSRYPVNTLLGNLDWINNSNNVMLVCLGDLFMDVKNDIPQYKTSLFDKLNLPLFNAVGNHDLTENIYQNNFGATFYYFWLGRDIHFILDTEIDNGDIKDEQLEILNEIEAHVNSGNVNNVFIYGHRTIWKDTYQEMDGLFEDNTQSLTATNFETTVKPVLTRIARKSKVFVFAGSLGEAPASFFYFNDKASRITFIATAIRGLLRDAMLVVKVNNGAVSFETKSLTNQPVEVLENYNVDFWKSTSPDEKFNYRLIPYYLKLIILHRFFWYGTGFAFILFIGFNFIRKKFRKS